MVSQVGIDNDEAMESAIYHLSKLGHRKIGYISGGLGSYIYQERYLAFFRALRKHGLEDDRLLAGHSFSVAECLYTHLPRLLNQGCTAFICSHDLLARDVMNHCRREGLGIPEDVSILGIDDLPICRETTPALSSNRRDLTELGKGTYHALTKQIGGIRIGGRNLHPEVILRASVGPAKK